MLNNTIITINQHSISIENILYQIIVPIIAVLLGGVAFYFIVKLFLQSLDNISGLKLAQKTKPSTDELESDGEDDHKENFYSHHTEKWLRKIIKVCVFVGIMLIIMVFIGNLFLKNLFSIFVTPFYVIGNTKISLVTTFLILLLGYVSYLFSNFIRKISKKIVSRLPISIARKYSPIIQIFGYAALILSFIIGLSLLGVNFSSFTVLFGVLGVGLGFGLQDIVANFFSGLVISFSGIIKEGDRVFIENIEGNVVRINLINTVIRSLFQEELIVPNKTIINEPLQNYSHSDNYVVIGAKVSVDYSSDMHLVEKVLIECAGKLANRIEDRDISFRFKSFGDSGIEVCVYVAIYDVKDKYASMSQLHMFIWEAFKEHNINIPFPQVEMRVKKPDIELSP